MFVVVLVNVWRGLPFFAITLLAGLVAIPRELYEAAEVDGAGAVRRFWHITLPLVTPVLGVVILFSAIFTLSDFNIVYVLTKGGPMNMTPPLRHLLLHPRPAGRRDRTGRRRVAASCSRSCWRWCSCSCA